MTPNKKPDEYTRYCITPEGKEYLRLMLEGRNKSHDDEADEIFELDMNEEIDFEDLRIIDDDEEFEPDEDDLLNSELPGDDSFDEFFRLNEEDNDDDYDFWKERES